MNSGRIYKWKVPIKPGQDGYIPMREAIRSALIEKNINPKRAAQEAGLDRFYLYDFLCGHKEQMEAEKAAKALKLLGLDLKLLTGEEIRKTKRRAKNVPFGGVVDDAWREKHSVDPIEVAPDANWPAEAQAVFLARVPSIDEIVQPGDMILAVVKDYPIIEGAHLLVRKKLQHLEQISIFRAHIRADGEKELWPATKDIKKSIQPLVITRENKNEWEIIGAVIRVLREK